MIPVIAFTRTSPYMLIDCPGLINSRDEHYPPKPVISLSRCGGPANKPFCDGAHIKNGFNDPDN